MTVRSVHSLPVDDNTLKDQPEKESDKDLSTTGDNVRNNLELLDSTMPVDNSLMGGSARGNQVDIGWGDSIAGVQPSMERS